MGSNASPTEHRCACPGLCSCEVVVSADGEVCPSCTSGWHGFPSAGQLAQARTPGQPTTPAADPDAPARIDCGAPPGHVLRCQQEPGGDRWHLDGQPVHAGSGVELLMLGDGVDCDCDEGCAHCGGRCSRHMPRWVRCRFEFRNTNGHEPVAWLYLPVLGANARVTVEPGMHCRWPG